ncbi:ADP-ribosylglycohydrolase family protein [Microbacterium sp. RD1]|uniref:ADP-ribosylglycohydrolase family protein n=1 Tax=Microbacterium sp. RD1 TaxID=3457313 RepID=UPI003FA5411A
MEYITDQERAFGISQEPYGLATNELQQARETGHDVTRWEAQLAQLDPRDDEALTALYRTLPQRPARGWDAFEASELDAIVAALPAPGSPRTVDRREERVAGAWYGRIAGNMLGKPVEFGWPRARITAYLEERDALPLDDYIPIDDEATAADQGFFLYEGLSRGRVDGGVRDDDIDYTVLGLHLLETYGARFTRFDVAREWLTRFPAYQVYTAERATYQNLVREVPLESAGEHHNPYREWIGALIRADAFGYAFAGDPRGAALVAYADASLSHRANGIYGEMWAAALISSAFTAATPEESVRESLNHVPATSRLGREIALVLDHYRDGWTWEQTLDALDTRYERMSWVHTLNNAGALAAAILWGEGDYTTTIGYAVRAGLDTDSIGATAGSWAGAFAGIDAIPSHWIEPLHDRTSCALFGYGELTISSLVARTLALQVAS